MGDSLPWAQINRCAKFDAASFNIVGEICDRINKKTQTVNNISTPCLLARVDKKHQNEYNINNSSS